MARSGSAWAGRAAFAVAALLLGSYYLWAVRSAGYDFRWGQDLEGYYDHLGRAFAGGHLYLPVRPSPRLLAMPNPWDPKIDDSLKMFDAVLYNRRYYLYHGAGPAVMLFAPWRIATGHDLPENFALFLFCFGGALFAGAALVRLLGQMEIRPGPAVLAGMLVTLGASQAAPFLTSRVWVYEIAIAAGYFCISAGLFFAVSSWRRPDRWYWPAAAGLLFGMAIACRPHLGLVGVSVGCAILWRVPFSWRAAWRRAAAFAIPFAAMGAGVAIYNYARFGSPFEFGNSYLLGAANQNVVHLRAGNLAPGLYYMLASAPDLSAVFPWARAAPRLFGDALPAGYVVEPIVGGLFLAPVMPFALLAFFTRRARPLLAATVAAGLGILLFIAATGWSVPRYQADFLPLFVFAAMAGAAAFLRRPARPVRWIAAGLFGILSIAGIAMNLALAVSGPYDEMARNKPARFVRIAGWFSPSERHRPQLNPRIDVTFRHAVHPAEEGVSETLLEAGIPAHRYRLSVEHFRDKWRFVSRFRDETVAADLAPPREAVDLRVRYAPGAMRVFAAGGLVLEHRIETMVSAPAQVSFGSGRLGFGQRGD